MERRSTTVGLYIRSTDRVTADRGEAGGMREPGGSARPRISGGAEGGRSQGASDRSTGRGGEKGSAAGGGAKGSSLLGEAGECTMPQGIIGEGEGLQEIN